MCRMTIRLLQAERELEQARALHASSESCGPLPEGRALVGAVTDEGEVVALLGVGDAVFLGPLVVAKEWRGRQFPAQLVEYIEQRIPQGSLVVAYTASGHVQRLAREFGMKTMPGEWYAKEVA
jgi:GNAT superfamily N-acetyltransferase